MSAAVPLQTGVDQTEIPDIVRGAVKLGILESAFILIIGLVSKLLDGPVEGALLSVLVTIAILAVTIIPGTWTRASTIEGIAGAAGIGLGPREGERDDRATLGVRGHGRSQNDIVAAGIVN